MPSNPNNVIISGLGVHSSLGGILDASAAFRCGLSRARELHDWPYFDEDTLHEQLLVGHTAAGMSDGFQGIGRYIKMACNALEDMKRCSDLINLDPNRLGLFLVFSKNDFVERNSVDFKKNIELFQSRLFELSGIRFNKTNIQAYFEGRIGIVSAFRDALDLLEQGNIDHCLIGALDTLLDAQRLYGLIATNRIKTIDNPNGLMPGEAACFILVEHISRFKDRGGIPEIIIDSPPGMIYHEIAASDKIPGDSEGAAGDQEVDDSRLITTGEALNKALVREMERANAEQNLKGTIYCDLNGENSRATEFGNALVRILPNYNLDDWKFEIPALSFGDTGAASGLLAACLAARALSKGYCFGDKSIITISSDQGERGTLGLRRIIDG